MQQWITPKNISKNILAGQIIWIQAHWIFKIGIFLTFRIMINIYLAISATITDTLVDQVAFLYGHIEF